MSHRELVEVTDWTPAEHPKPPLGLVDCHTHVVPSGDDGASTLDEGRALCLEAARRGTAILFATPHVWPHLPLTVERERQIREAYTALRERAGLELRLGYELTPTQELLGEDPWRYELERTGCVLMEVPFHGDLHDVVALAEHIQATELTPVIAHPERGDAILGDPPAAAGLAERGWQLQVNATSLLGRHGPAVEALGWQLVEDGTAGLVASDGHRATRPPHLDEAYAAVIARLGVAGERLFDGSALGLARPRRRLPSPAASRGA